MSASRNLEIVISPIAILLRSKVTLRS